MQQIASVRDADVAGKRVLMRVDFDVPLSGGSVANDARIKAALPTLALLRERGASQITLIAHVGRPEGVVVEGLKMAPIEARLRKLTDMAGVTLLENLRFDPGEEANDPAFAQHLASFADIYVNEAFADSHREHASIVGVPRLLPSFAGLRFEEEVAKLNEALTPPEGSVAILGGAKFETKQPLIEKLLTLYTHVLVGGALGNDLIKSRGLPFGASLISTMPVPVGVATSERLEMPKDCVVLEVGANAERTLVISDIRAGERIIDIGPATAAAWSKRIAEAPFVLWNGPMGVYEEGYTDGTDALAEALAAAQCRAVIGGGDTAAAVSKYAFDLARVFVSTGGGAMLHFLADGTLPAIEALKNAR